MKLQNETDINIVFESVIKLVEQGLTIRQALIKINYHSGTFYRKLNKEQMSLLQITKTANKKFFYGGQKF